jgi:hypothetical protein
LPTREFGAVDERNNVQRQSLVARFASILKHLGKRGPIDVRAASDQCFGCVAALSVDRFSILDDGQQFLCDYVG